MRVTPKNKVFPMKALFRPDSVDLKIVIVLDSEIQVRESRLAVFCQNTRRPQSECLVQRFGGMILDTINSKLELEMRLSKTVTAELNSIYVISVLQCNLYSGSLLT